MRLTALSDKHDRFSPESKPSDLLIVCFEQNNDKHRVMFTFIKSRSNDSVHEDGPQFNNLHFVGKGRHNTRYIIVCTLHS